MRHSWAIRLLNVLACAPVIALLAVTSAPGAHAQTNGRPVAVVVAIDAGHGGAPDNSNPGQPFDPGVIGPAGTMEKDLTLDIARRVQRLLVNDRVRVVMTRVDDRFVDIGPRMDAANAARASLFVSIHLNSYSDPSMGGALVLYPDDSSLAFAQLMSDTLARSLGAVGIVNDGVQAKSDLWVHAGMPAVTVEGAYLSNPREEQLLASLTTRDTLAAGIVSGIERQAPAIASRRASILAWEQAHGIHPTPLPPIGTALGGTSLAGRPGHSGQAAHPAAAAAAGGGSGVRNGLLVLLGMAGFWQRRALWRGTQTATGLLWLRLRGPVERSAVGGHRRRLKLNRRQAVLQRSRRAAMSRRSVYDEFSI